LEIFFHAPSVVWALLSLRTFSCPPRVVWALLVIKDLFALAPQYRVDLSQGYFSRKSYSAQKGTTRDF